MTSPFEDSVAVLEAQLDETSRALSAVPMLTARDAERIAEKIDRLASQLLEVTATVPMSEAHASLGTTPASAEEFAALAEHMLPPDGEG